ncbi:DUF418 domain-containing protein [Carboxylicivirga sediminis]|uniref:DUF418 domain-containing protein n=1 Tax=Carboxylicivirga sediminis TaxID=2006564 RepID=A0A941IX90_9BACT|nr:DUF418 domain-containing protein [Carboxylicivirga sediminis]MBR8535363.1 DUF418 domain-containing protein [Carboxylicivirga sediminis]
MKPQIQRLHVIDALRGFAIVAIMLLHNLEHFDFYFLPPDLPEWMVKLDQTVWDTLFFLFASKSYSIFALLFGLTFFIQSNNQQQKGKDFRGRFAWRLVLLFAFGMLNSLFFQGDILTIYAVIGFLLIPLANLPNKALVGIAIVMLLQPLEWMGLIEALQNPAMEISNPVSWTYFGKMQDYIPESSIINTWAGNITNGKKAVLLWNWENGRFFIIFAMFLFGLVAGRKQLFVNTETTNKFWKKVLIAATMAFIILYPIRMVLPGWIESAAIERSVMTMFTPWTDIALMLVWVSVITLLFQKGRWQGFLMLFAPLGKMSLSNYMMQSVLGSSIYYGYGLALYQYTGATYSFLIAILLTAFTGIFCHWWAKHYKHGPLEGIWHKLTWIGTRK